MLGFIDMRNLLCLIVILLCAGFFVTREFADQNTDNQNNERNTMSLNQTFQVTNHEVTFNNVKDGITLSGTLSLPQGVKNPAVVVLVSGYGPNDRDCTIMGRKLFLPIANYFAQHGIAVLCYDKRGIGKSTGMYDVSVTSADFSQDVLAAVNFLKERTDINASKIGLVGSSEGGLISFMVASQSSDVAFVVSMAGSVSNDVMTHYQAQLKADGASQEFLADDYKVREKLFEIIKTEPADVAKSKLQVLLKEYLSNLPESQKEEAKKLWFAITQENCEHMITTLNSAWYRFYLKTDSLQFLSKVTVPVLAIHGDLDFFIMTTTALPKMKQGLIMAGNQDVTIIEIPNQNHWFQECKTGALSEYSSIQETMAASTLKLMTDWIISKTN
jgi:uncharacterized protein